MQFAKDVDGLVGYASPVVYPDLGARLKGNGQKWDGSSSGMNPAYILWHLVQVQRREQIFRI